MRWVIVVWSWKVKSLQIKSCRTKSLMHRLKQLKGDQVMCVQVIRNQVIRNQVMGVKIYGSQVIGSLDTSGCILAGLTSTSYIKHLTLQTQNFQLHLLCLSVCLVAYLCLNQMVLECNKFVSCSYSELSRSWQLLLSSVQREPE